MTEFFKVMIMSVVQGLTEFLPVSSSGHLGLAKHFLDLDSPGVSLELFLHLGTLVSVVVYYRSKLSALLFGLFRGERASVLYALWVVCSMLPLVAVYPVFGEKAEALQDKPAVIAALLCVTGIALLSLKFVNRLTKKSREKSFASAVVMGVAQSVAMLPGISRSGSTIVAARWFGLKPGDAAEFSFLMSIPVIAIAVLKDLLDGGVAASAIPLWMSLCGAVVAAAVGTLAISTFVKLLKFGVFWVFGVYCLVVGIVASILIAAGF